MDFGKESIRKKRKAVLSKKAKIANKCAALFFTCVMLSLLALAVCVGSAGYGLYNGVLAASPDIQDIDATPTGFLSTIVDAKGNTTATLVASGSNRIYVTLDEIPVNLQNAFIAVEDARFREHNGIDIKGIIRAGVKGIASGFHFSEGASTITQQLLKNNVFTNWTSENSQLDRFKRKIQEQYLALQLEKVQSKEWILENYLNTVNLGANSLGVQSAARRYFGKDVSKLNLSECTVIAGITKNPSGYNPISHPKKNAERRKQVLDDMKEQGMITKKQYKKALADDVYSRIKAVHARQEEKSSIHSYFDDAVIEQVIDDLMERLGYTQTEAYKALYNSGLTIYSTQDPDMQAICEQEINNIQNYPTEPKTSFSYMLTVQKKDGSFQYYDEQTMLSYYRSADENFTINFSTEQEALAAVEKYKRDILEKGDSVPENGEVINYTIQPQAAVTVIDQSSGEVKAIVGGRGEKTGNLTLNRATSSVRQPGSTFKILAAFAPALDTGKMSLAFTEDDAPYTYKNGVELKNYDKIYRGYTSIREAITHSINVVTVKTLADIGIDTGYYYLTRRFGFTTLTQEDYNEALALGGITKGVTNLELTAAYAAIAGGGQYTKPRLYTKILDHEGNVLLDNEPQWSEAVSEKTAWLLTNAMQDVMTRGTGQVANFEGMSLAGKSGTTTKNKDALFAGFSPYYTCVVWGGFDDATEQDGTQVAYPKLIWKAVMSRVHEGLAKKKFKKPHGIVKAEVCKESGLLMKEGVCTNDPRGGMAVTEYFDEDYVPKEECDHHALIKICAVSGKLAGMYCPVASSSVRLVGGEPGSMESAYMYTGDLADTCLIHLQPTNVPDSNTQTDDSVIDDTQTDDTVSDDTNADNTNADDTGVDDGEGNAQGNREGAGSENSPQGEEDASGGDSPDSRQDANGENSPDSQQEAED